MRTTDGFELAEVDLQLRGEGTIDEHGAEGTHRPAPGVVAQRRRADRPAREVAFEIIDADPTLDAHPDLLDELALLFTDVEAEFLARS